ncbi:DUF6415 family natural product biosynthesis protein [Streptomyces sp. NPDC055897]
MALLTPHKMPASGPGHPMPSERAKPPLDADELAGVLAKIRVWNPLVPDAVFDDLDRVLGDKTPQEHEIDSLAEGLRGTLMQLVNIAVTDPHFPATEEIDTAVERARKLRTEDASGGYRAGLGLTRRLAWCTWELLELLIESKQVKDAE